MTLFDTNKGHEYEIDLPTSKFTRHAAAQTTTTMFVPSKWHQIALLDL
jgi:hypothetical protein